MFHPNPEQLKTMLAMYRTVPARIKVIKHQLGGLYGGAESIYSRSVTQVNDGMPRPSQPGNKTASIALDNLELLQNATQNLLGEQQQLELVESTLKTALSILPDFERAVVTEKYINCKSWTNAAYALGETYPIQSERTLIRKGEAALQTMCSVVLVTDEQYTTLTRR